MIYHIKLFLSYFNKHKCNLSWVDFKKSQSQSQYLIHSWSQSRSQTLRPKYQSLSLSLKIWDFNPKSQSQSQNLIPRGESLSISLKNWYQYKKSQSQSQKLSLISPSLSLSLNVKILVSHIPGTLFCMIYYSVCTPDPQKVIGIIDNVNFKA